MSVPAGREKRRRTYIGLGSSIAGAWGSPETAVLKAVDRLGAFGEVTARSGLWRSPAWPEPSDPPFINAAVELQTPMAAAELVRAMHTLEREAGRVRGRRNAPRPLDLDLLDLEGNTITPTDEFGLRIPHPRLGGRAFVLLPLRDVAPRWRHPQTGDDIEGLIRRLPHDQREAVRRVTESR